MQKFHCPKCRAEVLTTVVANIKKDGHEMHNLYCASCGMRAILIVDDEILNTPVVDLGGDISCL